MGKLDGMVALVTGAGRKRGIGRAIAIRLAEDGADVAVTAIHREPSQMPEHEQQEGWKGAESVAEEIRAMGRKAIAIDLDVSKPDQVAAAMERTQKELGQLTGLVNNAGIASEAAAAPITEMTDELWLRTIDINLNGVYYMSKAAGRIMLAHGKPSAIVNISSLAGRFGFANYGGYCASKFGVIGLTQQMALELSPKNIRVNCICPGSIDTDMLDGTMARKAKVAGMEFAEFKASYNQSIIPMGRRGLPSEQASVAAFLLGPDAAYVTGQTINVDGGYRMD
jgi:3-oxoacyl-[acyl-carrier protein] reductase/meso-butanediol dehydrogenase/(S,S)-butanediol dehydrogenase/diacetyl reductase